MARRPKKFKVPTPEEIAAAVDAELADRRVTLVGRAYDVSQPESVEDFKNWLGDWIPRVLNHANGV